MRKGQAGGIFALLRILLVLLGAAAVLIALMDLHLGPQVTAGLFESAFNAAAGGHGTSGPWPPTMDSELRFYSAIWGGYGVLLIWTAVDLTRRLDWVPGLAGVFFLGGLGRVLSLLMAGPPHPFFVLLMWIELATPPVLILLWLGVRRRA